MPYEPLIHDWADGTHAFALDLGKVLELEELCDAGLVTILSRLRTQTWRYRDIRETIRLSLICGERLNNNEKFTATEAAKLTERYVDGNPFLDNVDLAIEIIAWRLAGAPPADKTTAPNAKKKRKTDASTRTKSSKQGP